MKTNRSWLWVAVFAALAVGGCASLYTDPFAANPEKALRATADIIQKVAAQGGHVCVRSLDGQETIDAATPDGQTLVYQYTRLGDEEKWRRHTARSSTTNHRFPIQHFFMEKKAGGKTFVSYVIWYDAGSSSMMVSSKESSFSSNVLVESGENILFFIYQEELEMFDLLLTDEKNGKIILCSPAPEGLMMEVL